MARSNRTGRRTARETGDNESNTNVENVAEAVNQNPNVAGNGGIGNIAAAAAAAGAAAAAPVGLEAVLGMLAQVLQRLPAVAPAQVVPPVGNVEPAVEVEEVLVAPRAPSYLKVMEHMQKLGTKFFTGGSRPLEADEWMNRLGRNFDSIRCPETYKVDIAIHYLEGDAHNWWRSVLNRRDGRAIGWRTFREEFRKKYFPREAFVRLEGAFIDLHQGDMTVREYEAEFNRLMKYGGRDLEDDENQVRRFMRGLRVEISTPCKVREYATLAELVEIAALQESGRAEMSRQLVQAPLSKSVNVAGKNAKFGKLSHSGKPSVGRSACLTCGKNHPGPCRRASGACHRCGKMGHMVRDCPEADLRLVNPEREAGQKVCFNCGEAGHYKNQCPKLAQQAGKRPSDGMQPQAKRQAVMPRVYTIGEGTAEASTSRPITGKPYLLP